MNEPDVIWRPVTGWPYKVNSKSEVWSVPRTVPAKAGSTRTTAARELKPVAGQVWLSDAPRKKQFTVTRLFRELFPELAYPKCQAECRNGHPLFGRELLPAVTYWGCGNRICRRCHPDLPAFDRGSYSGAWGTGRAPDEMTKALWPVIFG
jgi:hypothetical protein